MFIYAKIAIQNSLQCT